VLEDLERRQAEEAGARLICSARPSTRTRTRPCSAFGKIIILHFNRSSSIRSLCYSMLPKRKKIGHGRYQRLLPWPIWQGTYLAVHPSRLVVGCVWAMAVAC
jgi:hypothetical protein